MSKSAVCSVAIALLLLLPNRIALGQDTGLASLHDWVRIGGKTCMADHFHDGSGSGPTRGIAQAAAVRAWQDFTAWEYGGRWGSYGNAISRSVRCSGVRGYVSCSVSARPCRR
jgi:hypothetical protein